jgi:hypothetical protein
MKSVYHVIVILVASLTITRARVPERKVEKNVISSERDPKVRITLPETVQYVGADRWDLLGIADCELHAFVDADENKNVTRLYWVQFEQYLPSKPDLHHQYDSPRHATIGGLDFYVDLWAKFTDKKPTPGSDGEHIRTLIQAKGYKLPATVAYVRLVHLLDEQKRKELMIIYAEDLALNAFSDGELANLRDSRAQLLMNGKGLVERATQKVAIESLK